MIKFVLLLYVLYPSESCVLVDRLPEVFGFPPKRVTINKRLYFCVSYMCIRSMLVL
jgi:hypothetical protein